VYDPMEAIGRTRDELADGAGSFREASASLGPVTAKDNTGAITVTLDGDGRLSSILVSMTWRNSHTAHSLAAGINDAATKAGVARVEQWGGTLVEADERRSERVVAPQLDAEDLATRLSEAVDRDRSGSVDASAVLNVVAVLQLIVGFAALTLLGAFQSANALQVFLATMVVSVAVLVLGVSLARHVSRVH
jgi:hypothetical protein